MNVCGGLSSVLPVSPLRVFGMLDVGCWLSGVCLSPKHPSPRARPAGKKGKAFSRNKNQLVVSRGSFFTVALCCATMVDQRLFVNAFPPLSFVTSHCDEDGGGYRRRKGKRNGGGESTLPH